MGKTQENQYHRKNCGGFAGDCCCNLAENVAVGIQRELDRFSKVLQLLFERPARKFAMIIAASFDV